MEKIHFTPKDILQKDFKQKMRGYDPTDVDSFLDMVIRDYENFNKTTQQLREENDQLRDKIDELNEQISMNQNVASTPSSSNNQPEGNPAAGLSTTTDQSSSDQYAEILQRLTRLENKVFGPDNAQSNDEDGSHRL